LNADGWALTATDAGLGQRRGVRNFLRELVVGQIFLRCKAKRDCVSAQREDGRVGGIDCAVEADGDTRRKQIGGGVDGGGLPASAISMSGRD